MTALIAFFCTFCLLLKANIGKADNQFETIFSIPDPVKDFPLRNIEVDPQNKDIFVSGKNVLYKLLKEKNYGQIETKSTGPKRDCFPEVDSQKYCGDDENSVMVVTPNLLITCSTLQGGLCRKRNKMNLDSIVASDKINVGLVSKIQASALGGLITVNVKTESGTSDESRLLFAKSKTPLPSNIADQLDRAAIFSVALDLPQKRIRPGELDNKEDIFDMLLREDIADQTKMEYKAMMKEDDFVFLLFNQNSKAKIAKICKSVDGVKPKRVYEDIPIYCYKDGTNFTQIEHGTFVSNSGSRYLVALFSNSEKSAAVCVFNETEIFNNFLESRRNRYGTCPYISLKDAAFEQQPNVTCQEWVSITEENETLTGLYDTFNKGDFCNDISQEYGVILGVLPLAGEALYTRDVKVTVVGSSDINDLILLYVGTQEGSVIKMFLDPKDMKRTELEEIKVDGSNIQAIRNVGNEIYIMSEDKIVKLLRKNCGNFSGSCQACMMAKDAHCGWCITSEQCVEKSECKSKTSYWLPSVRNQCLQLELEEESHYGVNLDNKLSYSLNVSFQPPQEGSDGMKCKLNDEPLPTEPGSDHVRCTIDLTTRSAKNYAVGNQSLSISLNGTILASTELVFYRCSLIDRCGECAEGGIKQCYWCVDEGSCKYSPGDCLNRKSVSPGETKQCPQILSSEVKIPNGRKQRVTFTGKNLETSFKYSCLVNEVPYPAALSGNNLSCDVEVSYEENKTYSDPKPITFKYALDSSAELKYDLDAFDGDPYLLAYKCEHLSSDKKDCSTCYYQKYIGHQCSYCGDDIGCADTLSCSEPDECKNPEITSFTPSDGAVGGGTEINITGINLGVDVDDINVMVAGVTCTNITLKNRVIKCITNEAPNVKPGPVVVFINGQRSNDLGKNFEYKDPVLRLISPNRIIQSGGRKIYIAGENLAIGDMNYEVKLIPVSTTNGEKSKQCSQPTAEGNRITCKPNSSTTRGDHKVNVTFDGKTTKTLDTIFSYLGDPTFNFTERPDLKTIKSGGTKFILNGTGFVDVLQNMYVELSKYSNSRSPCSRKSDEKIECEFPRIPASSFRRRRRKRQASNIGEYAHYTIGIHLDGFHQTLPAKVLYVSDPFLVGNQTISFDPDEQQDITLTGGNLAIVTKKEDYFILVGTGQCELIRLNDTELVCRPPSKEPAPRDQENELYIRVRVGNYKETVGVVEYLNQPPITYIVIGVLAFLLIVIVVGAVLIRRKMRARNQMKIKQIMIEMQDIEQNTMQMNQEEFAEMQLNITDIKRDLVSTGIPYHPYQNYVQYILFPQEVEAGTLNSLIKHSGYSSENVEKAMDQFDKLMTNKYFVKSLIGTLEKQRKISLIDKALFSANFSVVMMGNMRDFFDIVNCLLSTLVDSANKKAHKTLFNRFESITLRLLSHWLSVSLYPYLKEGGGSSLFMLYKSMQAVVEKRPVDEVTGEAKNTLCEYSFLREKIDCRALKLEIDLNGNGNVYTCQVLDCDTINQVKRKCLCQIYKNKTSSEMPTTDEVDLEWMAGKSGRLALSNIDHTSVREDNIVRRNTLQHYNVLDGSRMALLYKFSPDDEHTEEHEEDPYMNQRSPSDVDVEISVSPGVHLIQSVSSTGSLEYLRQWHLVKSLEEEEDSHEKTVKMDIVKTSHITNLMHTKLVLQDNIKEVFDSVLNHDTVPLVVHYLFGVLENLANKNGVEPDTLLCWKSESYAMRVWATLLVRPEFLFDIQKAKHVEPCLNVVKQVFIDCFHSTKISKDSSLQKLLFAQEVPHYQKKTEQFYKALANKAAVTDSDFWNEMSRLNGLQQEHLKFSKPAALQKLYKFVQQYVEDIIEDLDAGDETSGLQFGSKLDDIVRLMETDS